MDQHELLPLGTTALPGVVHRSSPQSVDATVGALTAAIEGLGAQVFSVIDQRAAAQQVGLELRETRLMIFGNPAGGTPLMQAVPLVALDLPLKILVWEDDSGAAWMTYLSADWLVERYGLSATQAKALGAPAALAGRVAAGN